MSVFGPRWHISHSLCVILQDVVRAKRVVLAGATLVSKRPGLGRPGGPGRPGVCQSS